MKLSFLFRQKRNKTIEERLAYLEGARTSAQNIFTTVAIIVGIFSGTLFYQVFEESINRNIETQVSTKIALQKGDLDKQATDVYMARNDTIIIATSISKELFPTNTPSPSPQDALRRLESFFDYLNNKDYIHAWDLVTDDYKYKLGQTTLDLFTANWKGVEKIDILEIQISSIAPQTTYIIARVKYKYSSTASQEFPFKYRIIYLPLENNWYIDAVINT
jgi:hypothetical protein